ncbi:MAG TPA: GNAT family N-acetyltransferase [Bacteroidia bacterium]|nr:GNAT family N-acetyltransferase [Bacteroidia bacterium]
MLFLNSTPDDLDAIFNLYDIAIAYQKKISNQHWLPFDPELVKKEIAEKRQWKIIINGEVASVFCVAYSDPLIWGEKDKEPSIYLHRIVTNPKFRGKNFVVEIINWALEFGKNSRKKYLRMDTWGDNEKLREYYVKCGFNFLEVIKPKNPELLPAHYAEISLSLFEIEIV